MGRFDSSRATPTATPLRRLSPSGAWRAARREGMTSPLGCISASQRRRRAAWRWAAALAEAGLEEEEEAKEGAVAAA